MIEQLPQEHLIVAIRCIAQVEAALEWTLDDMGERNAFGRPLTAFQNTRFKLAEFKAEAPSKRLF